MVIYNGVIATMEKEEPKWQSAVTWCLHGVWFKGKRVNKPKQPFVRCVAPTHCAALWAKRAARARAGEGEVAGFTLPAQPLTNRAPRHLSRTSQLPSPFTQKKPRRFPKALQLRAQPLHK